MNLQEELSKVQQAGRELTEVDAKKIQHFLNTLAELLQKESLKILDANQRDMARMDASNLMRDRLFLNEERIQAMAEGLLHVSLLSADLGEILESRHLSNDLLLEKVRVPFGTVAVIFEARPNVVTEVVSLCLKSGNACVLKAGSDAHESASVLVELIQKSLKHSGLNENSVLLLPPGREQVEELLKADEWIDVLIPRGGKGLIDFVVENSTIPVIKTGAGIVHTYVDATAQLKKAAAIILNAKTRKPSVCNALDTLLVHRSLLEHLASLVAPLAEKKVALFADEASYARLKKNDYPFLSVATEADFGTEFLSLKMSIKTVENVNEAIAHINHFGSHHSEAILSEDPDSIARFLQQVDAAVVYVNASTSFTDGAEFGLGAEIGISTQKLHARGPMGLKELTTYKWLVHGNGQVR